MNGEYVELTPADLAERWRERDPLEDIDAAARQVHEEYATPDSALRWLLSLAWGQLLEAKRGAINGRWSIQCENVVDRIAGLTRLVGPQEWESVPVDLILNGWYERVNAAAGHPTPLTDDDRRRAQEVLDRRSR